METVGYIYVKLKDSFARGKSNEKTLAHPLKNKRRPVHKPGELNRRAPAGVCENAPRLMQDGGLSRAADCSGGCSGCYGSNTACNFQLKRVAAQKGARTP